MYIDKQYKKRFEKEKPEWRGKPDEIAFNAETNTLVINGWYRQKLGIEPSRVKRQCLEITDSHSLSYPFRNLLQHPQTAVFITTLLTIVGLGLAFLGAGLGLIAIEEVRQKIPLTAPLVVTGLIFAGAGIIVCFACLVPLYIRQRGAPDEQEDHD